MSSGNGKLHLVLLSIHGLIRGHDMELGTDDDTGGQTRYVVELARALGERDDVARVDLLTRRVLDSAVSSDYARRQEHLTDKVSIIRIDCGEEAYIAKEHLWDCLDAFADNALGFLRENQLTAMPCDFGQLTALQELHLRESQLTAMPWELRPAQGPAGMNLITKGEGSGIS